MHSTFFVNWARSKNWVNYFLAHLNCSSIVYQILFFVSILWLSFALFLRFRGCLGIVDCCWGYYCRVRFLFYLTRVTSRIIIQIKQRLMTKYRIYKYSFYVVAFQGSYRKVSLQISVKLFFIHWATSRQNQNQLK